MFFIRKYSSKLLRNYFFVVYLHRDIDLNRASPGEEGVDVFNVTFFVPENEVGRHFSFNNVDYLTEVFVVFHIDPILFIVDEDGVIIKPVGVVPVFGLIGMFWIELRVVFWVGTAWCPSLVLHCL